MSVCVNRTDDPGFFTPCAIACAGSCRCGAEVKAELAKASLDSQDPELCGDQA